MPSSLDRPADSFASRSAAASSIDSTLCLSPSAICASASERDSPICFSERRSRKRARPSSTFLAMKIVQVITEEIARPIITILTMMSALRNIVHGDSSDRPGVTLPG